MTLHFEEKGDFLRVVLEGEIDHHIAGKLSKHIDEKISKTTPKRVSLDFSFVSFMDSSGIGMVIGRDRKLKQKGGQLTIEGCNDYVKRILEMAGIFTLVPYGGCNMQGGLTDEKSSKN